MFRRKRKASDFDDEIEAHGIADFLTTADFHLAIEVPHPDQAASDLLS